MFRSTKIIMSNKPLSPTEVESTKSNTIPDVVITAVNNLLVNKYGEGFAVLSQRDIVNEILRLDENLTRREIFDNNMLDFENVFRRSGWSIVYDKPGYNESYEPFFTFRKKRKR